VFPELCQVIALVKNNVLNWLGHSLTMKTMGVLGSLSGSSMQNTRYARARVPFLRVQSGSVRGIVGFFVLAYTIYEEESLMVF
jgi:hypothetical protein